LLPTPVASTAANLLTCANRVKVFSQLVVLSYLKR